VAFLSPNFKVGSHSLEAPELPKAFLGRLSSAQTLPFGSFVKSITDELRARKRAPMTANRLRRENS
jgi:hypothetical protein